MCCQIKSTKLGVKVENGKETFVQSIFIDVFRTKLMGNRKSESSHSQKKGNEYQVISFMTSKDVVLVLRCNTNVKRHYKHIILHFYKRNSLQTIFILLSHLKVLSTCQWYFRVLYLEDLTQGRESLKGYPVGTSGATRTWGWVEDQEEWRESLGL